MNATYYVCLPKDSTYMWEVLQIGVSDYPIQQFVGFLWITNFVINIIDTEISTKVTQGSPVNDNQANVFQAIDILFTVCYIFELMLNLFVHWWRPFVTDGWSIFDTFCIVIGLVGSLHGVSSAKVIRSIRILRIVRVLRRFKNLQTIVLPITRCVLPLLNTSVIVLVVNVIYAVMTADMF
jgi:hypothetical protein